MTLYQDENVCSLCGTSAKYSYIGSFSSCKLTSHLDMRSSQQNWVWLKAAIQCCPHCGYCADQVSDKNQQASMVIVRDDYRFQLQDEALPPLANHFNCAALIQEAGSCYGNATQCLLRATWVCDDADLLSEATAMRIKASDMIKTAVSHNAYAPFLHDVIVTVRIDLLRRSGRFDEARMSVAETRPHILDDLAGPIMDFESFLIDKGDTACHVADEAFQKGGAPAYAPRS